MTELIEKVKEAKKVLDSAQKELLSYCRDKSYPLDERWSNWTKYVDKDEQSYIGCRNSKILSAIIDAWSDGRDIDRHQTVDYSWLLESCCESPKMLSKIQSICKKHTSELRDKKIDSLLNNGDSVKGLTVIVPQNSDELEIFIKEEILIANFGSFEFDW